MISAMGATQRVGAGRGRQNALPALAPRWRASARDLAHNPVNNLPRFLQAVPLASAHLGAGSGELRSDPASFVLYQTYNTHSASPSQRLASVRMEKSVRCVSQQVLGSISEATVSEAREVHERLLGRVMASTGGNRKSAMYRAEAMFGLSYWSQHNLRYQNRASAEFVARLHAAWRSVLEASVQRDVAELLRAEAAE